MEQLKIQLCKMSGGCHADLSATKSEAFASRPFIRRIEQLSSASLSTITTSLACLMRSWRVAGYREHLDVVTLREFIAASLDDPEDSSTPSDYRADPWQGFASFLDIRDMLYERAVEMVEEEYEKRGETAPEIFIEFSALHVWLPGASIAPHFDSNRPYLRQRAFTLVAYLNSHAGSEGLEELPSFKGGAFSFTDQSGKEDVQSFSPCRGDLMLYSSGADNTHRVSPVEDGERVNFIVWFTLDREHCEDLKMAKAVLPFLMRRGGQRSGEARSEESRVAEGFFRWGRFFRPS